MGAPDPRQLLFDRARRQAGWTVHHVWLQTVAAGGTSSAFDVEAFLYGLGSLPPAQQDVLAHVLNERLADLYESAKVPYLLLPPSPEPPPDDPVAVLDHLLTAAQVPTRTPPEGAPGRPRAAG